MNENNQGQFAALLIFISILLVLGSLLTAIAETGSPAAETDAALVTDYIFFTPTPASTFTPTTYQTIPATPTATIASGIDHGDRFAATATQIP